MKVRKRLWMIGCTFSALTLAIGYLARPIDDYRYLRGLNPTDGLVEKGHAVFLDSGGVTIYPSPAVTDRIRILGFEAEPAEVKAALSKAHAQVVMIDVI